MLPPTEDVEVGAAAPMPSNDAFVDPLDLCPL